ncbi:hypothetical protein CBR_g40894 [Chara braunii]|uniref:Uncharacterized protein n=1 Tax=Chara braunii TaxID=69332 RepID=A0A388K2B2_CHABU|nr:hypothetical protein CBR_g40894 [Chara braunii]|eukprot:GBG64194.1 hypothetical protein CBR_g40894 [Chara braunii]
MKIKHDADKERERRLKEDEDRKRHEREEEEKRLREKKEREELQAQMSEKIDKVYEAINEKKNSDKDKLEKLKSLVDEIGKKSRGASTSATGSMPVVENLEEVIHSLQRQCEAAEANAKAWKMEALRPENK